MGLPVFKSLTRSVYLGLNKLNMFQNECQCKMSATLLTLKNRFRLKESSVIPQNTYSFILDVLTLFVPF